MTSVKEKTINVTRRGLVLCSMMMAVAIPVLNACAGSPALDDPRQMTFKPVEFTPPEPDRVVLENGMVVYLLEDHELPLISMTATMRTGELDRSGRKNRPGLVNRFYHANRWRGRFVGQASGRRTRTVRRESRDLDRAAIRFCVARCAQQGCEARGSDFRRAHSDPRLRAGSG